MQAHVRASASDLTPRYRLTCIESIDGDEYAEAVTSEQTFDNHEECLDYAIAWAGHPHSAIVWDHVNGVTYDPDGSA